MRVLVASLALLGVTTGALGADLDVLRGSSDYEPGTPVYYRWAGLYAGGQIGFGVSHMNFQSATGSEIAYILRDTTLLAEDHPDTWPQTPDQNVSGRNYGFFFGYNTQWDDVILGVEINYNRTALAGSSTDSIARRAGTSDGYTYDVFLQSVASMNITDFGTLRGRAGYSFGRFLPYMTFGVAVGRADVLTAATVSAFGTSPGQPNVSLGPTSGAVTKIAYPYGYELGVGMDVALLPGIMVRAEYEYLQFAVFSNMAANIQTVRIGAGIQF